MARGNASKDPRRAAGPAAQTTLPMRCAPLNRAKTSRHTRTDKASLAHHGARQRFKKSPDTPRGRRCKPLGKLTVTRSASACGQGCDEPLGPSLLRDLDGDGGRRNLHSPHRSVPQASASRRRRFFMTAADVKKPLTGRSKDRPSVGPHNGVSCLVLYFPYTPCLKQNFKLSTVITAKPSRSSRRRKSYRQAWRSFAGAPAMGSCAIPPGARWAGAFFTACFCSVLCCHA